MARQRIQQNHLRVIWPAKVQAEAEVLAGSAKTPAEGLLETLEEDLILIKTGGDVLQAA